MLPSAELACARVASALPAVLGRADAVPAALTAHVEACLACQAELARYRRLLRLLAQLRDDRVELPAGALSEIFAELSHAARRRAVRSALTGHRLAYGGGLLAGCLAAAALVVLGRLRGSRQPAST